MYSGKTIHVISCHAEGEVGDVIVDGVDPPPGETLWQQRSWIAEDQTLRNFLLNEPRGGVFRHVNLLVPAIHPEAQMGWIIMEPEDTPPMSGSNAICVSTVLLESGIVEMQEPITEMVLEAPGGLVRVRAECAAGKVERVSVQNLPSFVGELGVSLQVPGIGEIQVDSAFGGDSFVVVDAETLANRQLKFVHPDNPGWQHFSFCLFAGPLSREGGQISARFAVAIQPGKIDRSPTGTAVSARMAILHAKGEMQVGDRLTARSIIDSEFQGRIVCTTSVGDKAAIVPEISGRGWITGIHQHMLDPDDPWPEGYRLSDTWPVSERDEQ